MDFFITFGYYVLCMCYVRIFNFNFIHSNTSPLTLLSLVLFPSGKNRPKNSLKECAFVNSALCKKKTKFYRSKHPGGE